ncbi:MAG: hypothetical protein AAGE98_15000 [Actinomycetota bacterium]
MGKASSSKKVQRAAKAAASSRGASEQRELGFPLAVLAVIVLGIGLVGVARANREAPTAPRVGDHWHSAYTIYDCGEEQALFQSAADPDGIHSHQDSVIHIHPFNSSATGEDAQLGVLLEAMRATVTTDAITTPEVGAISAADGCGDQAAVIKVARYQVDPTVELVSVFDDDFDSIPFLGDREAFVIAKVPAGEDPPPPSATALAALDGATGTPLDSQPIPLDAVDEDGNLIDG